MLLSCNACPREEKQRNAHEGEVHKLCGSINVVHIEEHVLDSQNQGCFAPQDGAEPELRPRATDR